VSAAAGIGLGLVLGARHALDADHLVAITAMLQERPGVRHALWMAGLWSLGHSLTLLAVGLPIILLGLQFPEDLAVVAEVMVGVMLVVLGVRHAWAHGRRHDVPTAHSHSHSHSHVRTESARPVARPLVIGLVHGLAGSHAVALLALAALTEPTGASVYLVMSALGMAVAMLAITALASLSMKQLMRGDLVRRVMVWSAATMNVGFGSYLFIDSLLS